MSTSAYADIDDLKRQLAISTTDTSQDDELERHILSASGWIDEELGRPFGATEGDDEVRTYAPGSARDLGYLVIDDLAELTSIRVDRAGDGTFETWTLDTDFVLDPPNAEVKGRPWTSIRTLSSQSFPSHRFAVVEVTGKFGWMSPPPQITEATLLLAEQLYHRSHSSPLGFRLDDGAVAYIARRDPHIAGLIRPFSRRALFV
jgi:hypothetical protein